MTENKQPCACMQNMRDLLIAGKGETSLVKRIECAGCGKIVWVNRETKYCFDCENKVKAQDASKDT